MYIPIHPERGLLRIAAQLKVGRCDQPDLAALMAFPDRLQPNQVRIFLCIILQKACKFRITIEFVKAGIWHAAPLSLESKRHRSWKRSISVPLCSVHNRIVSPDSSFTQ